MRSESIQFPPLGRFFNHHIAFILPAKRNASIWIQFQIYFILTPKVCVTQCQNISLCYKCVSIASFRWRENWQEFWSLSLTPKQEQFVSHLIKQMMWLFFANLLAGFAWFDPKKHAVSNRSYCSSSSVFSQGEEGTSWYIILKGSVNVVIYGKVSI